MNWYWGLQIESLTFSPSVLYWPKVCCLTPTLTGTGATGTCRLTG